MASFTSRTSPMESLPTELVREIFLRLPATTVAVAQRVCRSWRTIVGDPCFAREHLSSAVGGDGSGYLVLHARVGEVRTGGRCHLLTYVHDVDTQHRGMRSTFVPLCRKLPYFDRIAQSCDGLILLVDDSSRRASSGRLVHICNPLLGQWITLPEESYDRCIVQSSFTRLAFDATSAKYKVFRVTWLRHKGTPGFRLLCDVMSVGTGRDSPAAGNGWRRAGTVQLTEFCPDQPRKPPGFRNGILSGGQLHWLVWNVDRPAMMCIDVQSERIDFLSNLGTENWRTLWSCPLMINGRLCQTSFLYTPYKFSLCFYGRRQESSPAAADHPLFERLMVYDCSLDSCSDVIVTSSSKVHEMGALLFCNTMDECRYRHLQRDLRTNMTRRLRTPKYSGYEEIGLIDYTPSLLVPTI